MTEDELRRRQRAQERGRWPAGSSALVVLFYLITLVKMGGQRSTVDGRNRRTALLACLVIVGMARA